MPIDAGTVNSPGWWLKRLLGQLGTQRKRAEVLDGYYTNNCAIPIPTSQAIRDAYRRLMQVSRTDFAELVVEAVRERMRPIGFRTGADGDELGDREAWRIWQANSLDADVAILFRAKLSMADAYMIVGPVDDEIEAPLITVEDPREVITDHAPGRRRRTVAALKVFYDEMLGGDRAYLYLPGFVIQAVRRRKKKTLLQYNSIAGWEWQGEPEELGVPVVPVVRFANRADTSGNSAGEFETHRSILDRINYQILQRVEIVTMQAFRQRAVKGNLPDFDEAGNPIDWNDVFAADPGALWRLPKGADGEIAEIWESGQVDLGPIHTAIRDDVQDLAAVTRTPLFYLTPDAANGSAEGASLAREGLVFKTEDRITQASESLEQVMSLAFLFAGDSQRASRRDMETIWASPERHSLAERFDAASKAGPAGVPWRTVMSDVLQYSPQQIARMEAERAAEQLLAAINQPPPPAAVPVTEPSGAAA